MKDVLGKTYVQLSVQPMPVTPSPPNDDEAPVALTEAQQVALYYARKKRRLAQ
jgi:hypothetical protein